MSDLASTGANFNGRFPDYEAEYQSRLKIINGLFLERAKTALEHHEEFQGLQAVYEHNQKIGKAFDLWLGAVTQARSDLEISRAESTEPR